MRAIVFFLALSSINGFSQTQWIRQLGGLGRDEVAGLEVDSHGNSFITGVFSGTVKFGTVELTSDGESDAYLAKVDKDGNFLWQKRFGGSSWDEGRYLDLDAAGNVYVAGVQPGPSITIEGTTFPGNLSGGSNAYVAKFDTDGNFIWARNFGPSYSDCTAMDVNKNGDVLMFGLFADEIKIGPTTIHPAASNFDTYVIVFDSDGDVKWHETLGQPVTSSFKDFWPISAALDDQGRAYVNCSFGGTFRLDDQEVTVAEGGYNLFFAMIDAPGVCQWIREVERRDVFDEETRLVEWGDMIVDEQGNLFAAGWFWDWIKKDDLIVNGSYGNPGQAFDSNDVYVLKLNSLGKFEWIHGYGGVSYDQTWKLVFDNENNIYVSGLCRGAGVVDFGEMSISSDNSFPFFMKLNKNGNVLFVDKLGAAEVANTTISIDGEGNILYGGGFWSSLFENPKTNLTNQSTIGQADAFLLKYVPCTSIPDAPGEIQGSNHVCPGGKLSLTIAPVAGADHYIWLIGDQTVITEDPRLDTVFFTESSLIVKVQGANSCGSPGAASVPIHLEIFRLNLPDLQIPNVFTPNGDNTNEYFVVDEKLEGSGLKVVNRWGEQVFVSESYTNNWSAENLSSGVYYYTFKNECIDELKGILTILK